MGENLESFCRRTGRLELLEQWARDQNGSLSPTEVSRGSKRKVWWRCSQGHVWQAMVKSRTGGCGCPVCANRVLSPGINDLATVRPELAAQWHPTLNGTLTPDQVCAGGRQKAWWLCPEGHVWQAAVWARAKGSGCPVCAGRTTRAGENDLAALYPALAEEWHPTLNGTLTPQSVTAYSSRRVWWQCPQGHGYRAAVVNRTQQGSGCPYCTGRRVLAGFNDLATLAPEIAAQWHPTMNGPLTPQRVTAGSHAKVWWQCPEGHSWRAMVYARAGGRHTGCPVCAGRLGRPKEAPASAGVTAQGP